MAHEITVIIPARNEEEKISGCLRLILSDPLVSKVVVVSDRCSDNTSSIVADISDKDARCTLVERRELGQINGKHLGHYVAASINAGLNKITA